MSAMVALTMEIPSGRRTRWNGRHVGRIISTEPEASFRLSAEHMPSQDDERVVMTVWRPILRCYLWYVGCWDRGLVVVTPKFVARRVENEGCFDSSKTARLHHWRDTNKHRASFRDGHSTSRATPPPHHSNDTYPRAHTTALSSPLHHNILVTTSQQHQQF